jgi:hypothetical protein
MVDGLVRGNIQKVVEIIVDLTVHGSRWRRRSICGIAKIDNIIGVATVGVKESSHGGWLLGLSYVLVFHNLVYPRGLSIIRQIVSVLLCVSSIHHFIFFFIIGFGKVLRLLERLGESFQLHSKWFSRGVFQVIIEPALTQYPFAAPPNHLAFQEVQSSSS